MLFLSAGEVSGDLYGAALLKQLSSYVSGPYYGLGGPALRAAGQQQLDDVLAYSAVGLTENLRHLPRFQQLWLRLKAWLRQCRPTAVILVDFQGLNLRIGAYARCLGIPVFYFIAPQAWLWRSPGDLQRIAQSCDLVLSVFRPEHHFYQSQGILSVFVGHPVLDLLPSTDPTIDLTTDPPPQPEPPQSPATHICWLPGSRAVEVKRLTPVLRDLMQLYDQRYPGQYTHLMPVATPGLAPLLTACFGDLSVQMLPSDRRYQAMVKSEKVIGASGSAILEAVLLGKPTVALYRVSALTYAIAQRVFKHPYVTLPNLLLNQPLVPECLQHFDPEDLFEQAEALTPVAFQRASRELRDQLQATVQPATKTAALEIVAYLNNRGRRFSA